MRKREAFLRAAENYQKQEKPLITTQIRNAVNSLDEAVEKISLHYEKGGHSFQKGIVREVYSFWGILSNLDDYLKSTGRKTLDFISFVLIPVLLIRTFWFSNYAVPSGSAEPNLLIGDRICGVKYSYLFKNPKRGDLIIFDEVNFKYSQNPLLKIYQKYIGVPLGPLPAGPDAWTKRVVGTPGDRIKMSINSSGYGEVYVNGKKLIEPHRNTYPLILLHRTSGFLPETNTLFKLPGLGPILSSLLKKREVFTKCTFDPTKPCDKQPFYNFDITEVVLDKRTKKPYMFLPEKADPELDEQPEFVVPKGHIYCVGDNRWNSYDGRAWGCIPMSLVRGRSSFIYFSVDGKENWWFMEFLKNPVTFFTKKIRWNRCFKFLK